MAKDTEKLIRQLSLISFLMAERRPVSALEIKQDVEGYSEMNDDAFARRFYADRAELEGLGISLKVEKPPEGYFEAELYTLPRGLKAVLDQFGAGGESQWEVVLAASVIATVPMLVVFMVAQRYFVQGISTTGRTG